MKYNNLKLSNLIGQSEVPWYKHIYILSIEWDLKNNTHMHGTNNCQ